MVKRFIQTANKTVVNTVVETSLIGTGIGTLIIAANEFKIGSIIKGRAYGFFSRTSGNVTVRIKLGTVTLATTVTGSFGGGTNAGWVLDFDFTVRSLGVSGTIIGQGKLINLNTGNNFPLVMLTPVVIDTTINNTLDATLQYTIANAGNTTTTTNLTVQV